MFPKLFHKTKTYLQIIPSEFQVSEKNFRFSDWIFGGLPKNGQKIEEAVGQVRSGGPLTALEQIRVQAVHFT